MNLDASLLEILVCPACRAEVRADDEANELVCQGCGLAYPVRDDIPVMLVDEARRPPPPTRREPTRPDDETSQPVPGEPSAEQAAAEGPGDVASPDDVRA